MQLRDFSFLSLFLFFSISINAQYLVRGVVSSDEEGPLIGATVQELETYNGTVTDLDGSFQLTVADANAILVISYVGYTTQELEILGGNDFEIQLYPGELLDEVVIIGSRSEGRTKLETPVPVDIIDLKSLAGTGAQVNVNQIMNYVAPSFASNTQTISDGTDHIDPASLRGLGPDQVLVLINGKRRHTSALINVNGTFGRGQVGTDMNAIPVASIERIEILRDGASAQYGSDAIAGVINIILKDDLGLTFSAGIGANVSSEIPDTEADNNGVYDGLATQLSANYGALLGKRGGFLNITGAFDGRQHTNRMQAWEGQIFAGYNNEAYTGDPMDDITESELNLRGQERSDYNMRVGQSEIRNAGLLFNSEIPISDNGTSIYTFGGLNYRAGLATGFYRLPFESRNVIEVYPNGFLPEINSSITDRSLVFGMKSIFRGWDIDLSNTYGFNSFDFFISNTLNASLEDSSPNSFDAGGFSFSQNTTNLDLRQFYDGFFSGINIAFGSEYRIENYNIIAGEEASYTNYGLASWVQNTSGDSILVQNPNGTIPTLFGPDGSPRPGGAQVFPGFGPRNEVNRYRNVIAVYGDLETNFSESFLVGLAARIENYSDFGTAFGGKITSRYKLSDNFSIRGATSTGFRAPSLHQLYFNSTSTQFVDGIPNEVVTFSNDSRAAKLFGIPELKEETSVNFSAGITGRIPDADISISIDGYLVNINDRVVMTGRFTGDENATDEKEKQIYRLLQQANADQAAFFSNAIDTETQGLDVVITHNADFWGGILKSSLSGTFSQTRLVGAPKTVPALEGKESIYFDETNRIFLEEAVPSEKINLSLNYQHDIFNVLLRNVYFGEVTEATNTIANQQVFSAKVITDLSLGFKLSNKWNLTIGANNLLDVYPDRNIAANQSGGRFLYSRRSQQFGSNGRYLFGRLVFQL